MADFELESLASSVGGLFRPDMDLMGDFADIALLGVSATASAMLGEIVLTKTPFINQYVGSGWQKSVAKIGLGFIAGAAISQLSQGNPYAKGVAAGASTGLVLMGFKGLIEQFIAPNAGVVAPFLSLGDTGGNDDLLLGGLSVNDYQSVPGQMNGLGVVSRDLSPQPGGALGTWMS